MEDELFIKRCLELAKKGLGKTYPNPMVGAVIVHHGKIIGEGYHHKAGENHAEINAINSVRDKSLLPESTIYVSLEPCAHFGKTPPCALMLKEIGFKKVVVGCRDANSQVDGKGISILKSAGIAVMVGILEDECRALNKRFFCFHEKKRPYVILKWAESADGFLDQNFQPTQIGNTLTQQIVHQLRSDEDAILVGTNTALHDNPALTVRAVQGESPTRVLIDFDLKVPKDFQLFNDEAPTIIITSTINETRGNLKYITLQKENFLEHLMRVLHEENIQSIIIEGGSYTLQQFIGEDLWDAAVVIKNPGLYLSNGTPAPNFSAEIIKKENLKSCNISYFKPLEPFNQP